MVRVVAGGDSVRMQNVCVPDRVVAPPVVELTGELQTGHDTVTGIPASASLAMSGYGILRSHQVWICLRKIRRRTPQNLVLLPEQTDSLTQLE